MSESQKKPLISIIVTAYNVEDKIERALNSAIAQTYENTEIIVVEDCSTDNTLKVLEEYIKKHPHIRLVKCEENGGSGMAHRIGHENAKGEYVQFLDSDDWIDDDFLETLYRNADGADIVSGGLTTHFANGDKFILIYHDHTEAGTERMTNHFLVHNVYLTNRIVRKKLLDQYPYCTRRVIDDVTTLFPILYLANKVKFVEHPGYHLTQNPTSVTNTNEGIRDTLFRALALRDYIEFFKDKEEEYKKIFHIGHYLRIAQEIQHNFPPEIVKEGSEKWATEWKEFMEYLVKMENVVKEIQEEQKRQQNAEKQ